MATKTISIDLEAYERLRRARVAPEESFSKVIKRARWDEAGNTCSAFLRAMDGQPLMDAGVLDRLDEAQDEDAPPEDPWRKS